MTPHEIVLYAVEQLKIAYTNDSHKPHMAGLNQVRAGHVRRLELILSSGGEIDEEIRPLAAAILDELKPGWNRLDENGNQINP